MSFYSFIATTDEMLEVDYTNVKQMTVQEAMKLGIPPHALVPWEEMDPHAQILFIENEADLHELVIKKGTYYGVNQYTSYPLIYEVEFMYSESRIQQLLAYLKEQMREGQIIELWKVWIGDDSNHIPYERYDYDELSLNHLTQMYNRNDENYKEQFCLVIDRT